MGQAPTDVTRGEMEAIEREVDELRLRTEALLTELERRLSDQVERAKVTVERARAGVARVRRAIDLRLQLREHPAAAIGVGLGATALLGVGVYLVMSRRLAAGRPVERWRRRARAYRALVADPERVLRPQPRLLQRLVGAIAMTVTTTLARRLAALAARRALPA
jgi:hypothetical protein